MTSRENLKKWFKTGAKPTEKQFAEWLDSYRHVADELGISDVEGLTAYLNTTITNINNAIGKKQNKLIEGSNITIVGDVISASGGSGEGTNLGNSDLEIKEGDAKRIFKIGQKEFEINADSEYENKTYKFGQQGFSIEKSNTDPDYQDDYSFNIDPDYGVRLMKNGWMQGSLEIPLGGYYVAAIRSSSVYGSMMAYLQGTGYSMNWMQDNGDYGYHNARKEITPYTGETYEQQSRIGDKVYDMKSQFGGEGYFSIDLSTEVYSEKKGAYIDPANTFAFFNADRKLELLSIRDVVSKLEIAPVKWRQSYEDHPEWMSEPSGGLLRLSNYYSLTGEERLRSNITLTCIDVHDNRYHGHIGVTTMRYRNDSDQQLRIDIPYDRFNVSPTDDVQDNNDVATVILPPYAMVELIIKSNNTMGEMRIDIKVNRFEDRRLFMVNFDPNGGMPTQEYHMRMRGGSIGIAPQGATPPDGEPWYFLFWQNMETGLQLREGEQFTSPFADSLYVAQWERF